MIHFGLQALDLGTAELVKRLRKLAGKQLVSDQSRGEPCHAKLLSAMYQHYVHLVPAALLQRSKSRAYVVNHRPLFLCDFKACPPSSRGWTPPSSSRI